MRHLLALILPALLLIIACGDEEAAPSDAAPDDTCACPEGVCDPGECILVVQIDPGCEGTWGEASVFLHDVSNEATPVGTATVEQPFRTCEPLDASQPFTFVVESQDGRRAQGSVSPGVTFSCTGDSPFVFSASCQ